MPSLSNIPPAAWTALGSIAVLVLGAIRDRYFKPDTGEKAFRDEVFRQLAGIRIRKRSEGHAWRTHYQRLNARIYTVRQKLDLPPTDADETPPDKPERVDAFDEHEDADDALKPLTPIAPPKASPK